jgi:hypothetical protein
MSLSQPTMNGATHPEKLPTELMSAIPPAAALPASSIGGNCQKGAPAARGPSVPIINAANAITGRFANTPIETRPAAHAKQGNAAWYRRSSVRSECRLTTERETDVRRETVIEQEDQEWHDPQRDPVVDRLRLAGNVVRRGDGLFHEGEG